MLDNEMLKNHKLFVFWCWCLLKATHKKRTVVIGFTEIELLPGQFIYGRKKASKYLRMTEQNTRTCLKSLEKSKNLTIKSTNKFSIITICKWEIYQNEINSINQHNNQQLTNNQPTTNQQLTTDKNVKNGKNEKNVKKHSLFVVGNFNTFYAMYPKKTEKSEAWKQWLKLNSTDLQPGVIIAALSAQNNAGMFPEDKQYIMSPRKWLYGKRWEDEIVKEKSHGQKTGTKSNDRYYKRGGAAPRRGIEKLFGNNEPVAEEQTNN